MTDLEALENAAKAARDVGEAWLTHDDLTGVYPETMAFIVEASPTAILSLISAHRAALEKVEQYRSLLLECLGDYGHPNFTDRYGMADRIRAALEAP